MQWTRRLLAMAMASLFAGPASPGKTEALGIIVLAERANLGEHSVSQGSSVFDGESISTEDRGMLQLRSGPVQFNLLGESIAIVRGNADIETQTFSAELAKGTSVLSLPAGSKGEICFRGACIRAAQGGPLTVQVTVKGPKELRIYTRHGTALLTYRGKTATIAEGSSYIVVLDPPDDGSSPNAGGGIGGKWKKAFLLIAIAGTGAAILSHEFHSPAPLVESPDRP